MILIRAPKYNIPIIDSMQTLFSYARTQNPMQDDALTGKERPFLEVRGLGKVQNAFFKTGRRLVTNAITWSVSYFYT